MIRKLVAEAVGTAFLLAVVVGSGIAGQRLTNSVGLALLVNAIATGAGLVALILALGPASGAHFNPVVTVCDAWMGGVPWREAAAYVGAQAVGAVGGVMAANLIYGLPAVTISEKARSAHSLWGSEALATFGLLMVIWGVARSGRRQVGAFAVGAYIASAFFFTSSTSFANPIVTLARTLTNTFTGIRPGDALAFIPAQFAGGLAATALMRWIYPEAPTPPDAGVEPLQGNGSRPLPTQPADAADGKAHLVAQGGRTSPVTAPAPVDG